MEEVFLCKQKHPHTVMLPLYFLHHISISSLAGLSPHKLTMPLLIQRVPLGLLSVPQFFLNKKCTRNSIKQTESDGKRGKLDICRQARGNMRSKYDTGRTDRGRAGQKRGAGEGKGDGTRPELMDIMKRCVRSSSVSWSFLSHKHLTPVKVKPRPSGLKSAGAA